MGIKEKLLICKACFSGINEKLSKLKKNTFICHFYPSSNSSLPPCVCAAGSRRAAGAPASLHGALLHHALLPEAAVRGLRHLHLLRQLPLQARLGRVTPASLFLTHTSFLHLLLLLTPASKSSFHWLTSRSHSEGPYLTFYTDSTLGNF